MSYQTSPRTPKKTPRMPEKDKVALEHLSEHVNHVIQVLEAFKRHQANKEQVADAFRKLLRETGSSNSLESRLAGYIVNELKLLKLKIQEHGKPFNAFNYLEAYWNGYIRDDRTIKMGFTGLAGPATMMLLKNCKTDSIFREYQ